MDRVGEVPRREQLCSCYAICGREAKGRKEEGKRKERKGEQKADHQRRRAPHSVFKTFPRGVTVRRVEIPCTITQTRRDDIVASSNVVIAVCCLGSIPINASTKKKKKKKRSVEVLTTMCLLSAHAYLRTACTVAEPREFSNIPAIDKIRKPQSQKRRPERCCYYQGTLRGRAAMCSNFEIISGKI